MRRNSEKKNNLQLVDSHCMLLILLFRVRTATAALLHFFSFASDFISFETFVFFFRFFFVLIFCLILFDFLC